MSLNREETKGIVAAIMLEAIGKPPEFLTKTLTDMIDQIEKEDGVKVIERKINEPTPMKDRKDFFTNFAEVEVEVEEIVHLAVLLIKYMPSHVEIIYPELIVLTNDGWNGVLNELLRRLHGYDEIARVMQVEKQILETKLREILNNQKTESLFNSSKSNKNKKEDDNKEEKKK